MNGRKFISKSRRAKKTTKKPVKKAAKKGKTFAQKVLAVVHKRTEDKVVYTSNDEDSLVSFNSGINGAGDMLNIIPNMDNGVEINQRIGDKVIMQSHTIYGYFRIVPNTTALSYKFGNVAVRQMIISLKSISNYDAVINDTNLTAKLLGLLRKGGTTTGFSGIVSDVMADVNRDVFTLHFDKVYHIKSDYNMTAIGSTTQDTLRMFRINMKAKNKQLKYDNNISAGLLPTNYAPIMVFGYCYMDGSLPDTTSTNLQVYYSTTLKYEDA